MATASQPISEELSLGLLNINGLRKQTHEVRHIIARDKLHVVALCETKLNTKVVDTDVYLPGFRMWRRDKNDKSNNKGGGVALYVQDHIETILRPDLMEAKTNVKDPDVEIIWVEMKLLEGKPVLLGCCYLPKKDETKYLKHIKEMMELIEKEKDKDIFLMGDFNIDLLSDEKKKADDHLSTLGWNQIVKVPTRVTLDSQTCIDHIYTNISNPLEPKSILTGCSDHNLVIVTVKVSGKIPQSEGKFRSNQFEREKFQKAIGDKWGEVCKLTRDSNESANLKRALGEFTEIFLQVADEHAPLKSQDTYCFLRLNPQLERLVSDRDQVKYDMIKKIYQLMKKKKKLQETIDSYLKGKTQNPQEGGNDATESEETSPFHLPEIKPSEEENPQQINQTSTETTDSGSVPEDLAGGQRNLVDGRRSGTFSFKEISSAAVKMWLEYVCDHVVKVIDETEAELLKCAAGSISAPIRDILSGYIKLGEIPEEFKKIKLFPFSPENYIQIRQSSGADRVYIILSHVFYVILYEQVKSFFNEDGKKSATLKEKLKQLETDRNQEIKANIAVEAVLLDFTSSFDTISHDLLITKLEESGFSDLALELIKSFLSIHEGSSGFPRGSCFAQLLRIIIINDLKEKLEPSAFICNSYMMIYGNKSKLDEIIKTVKNWDNQFNIPPDIRQKQFEPSELPVMFDILKSMLRCHGDESNWIRAPGNIVKQNGDWIYDEVSKKLELNFGREYKVEPQNVNNSQQKSQIQNTKQPRSEDSAGDISCSGGSNPSPKTPRKETGK